MDITEQIKFRYSMMNLCLELEDRARCISGVGLEIIDGQLMLHDICMDHEILLTITCCMISNCISYVDVVACLLGVSHGKIACPIRAQ